MLPARTEVILVADLDLAAEGVTDPDILFLPGLLQAEGRIAVAMAANPERVQVIAIPSEHHLDHPVQVTERSKRRYDDAAPDRRLEVLQLNLQLRRLVNGQRDSGRGQVRHRPSHLGRRRMAARPDRCKPVVDVGPGHSFPQTAQGLVGAALFQTGGSRLDGEPQLFRVGELGRVVPADQRTAGMHREQRLAERFPPGRQSFLPGLLGQISGQPAHPRRHRSRGPQNLPHRLLRIPLGHPLPGEVTPLRLVEHGETREHLRR